MINSCSKLKQLNKPIVFLRHIICHNFTEMRTKGCRNRSISEPIHILEGYCEKNKGHTPITSKFKGK